MIIFLYSGGVYVGCFYNESFQSDYNLTLGGMINYTCSDECRVNGFLYVGLHDDLCLCSCQIPHNVTLISAGLCGKPCLGNIGRFCGGNGVTSVYSGNLFFIILVLFLCGGGGGWSANVLPMDAIFVNLHFGSHKS